MMQTSVLPLHLEPVLTRERLGWLCAGMAQPTAEDARALLAMVWRTGHVEELMQRIDDLAIDKQHLLHTIKALTAEINALTAKLRNAEVALAECRGRKRT